MALLARRMKFGGGASYPRVGEHLEMEKGSCTCTEAWPSAIRWVRPRTRGASIPMVRVRAYRIKPHHRSRSSEWCAGRRPQRPPLALHGSSRPGWARRLYGQGSQAALNGVRGRLHGRMRWSCGGNGQSWGLSIPSILTRQVHRHRIELKATCACGVYALTLGN